MKSVHALIQPFNALTGLRENVYLASGDAAGVYGVGAFTWLPAFIEEPQNAMQFFDLDLSGAFQVASSSFQIGHRMLPLWLQSDAIMWNGAPLSIWTVTDENWTLRTVEFVGTIASANLDDDRIKRTVQARGLIDRVAKPLLSLAFDGSGGLGGDPERAGLLKPAGFGVCENVEIVFFDEARSIGMIDGYGNLISIQWMAEGLAKFAAAQANYANYAALSAASDALAITEGRWASAIADGIVGFGAPPTGRITCAATFGYELPGELMERLLITHAGIDAGDIMGSDFAALDLEPLARPLRFWTQTQVPVKDVIERAARDAIATPLILPSSKIGVKSVLSAATDLLLDKSGNLAPRVLEWKPGDAIMPFWQTQSRAERPGVVLTRDEVNYEDDLEYRGLWSGTDTYRQGMWVDSYDGSQWLYINATPSKGNPPIEGAYWTVKPGSARPPMFDPNVRWTFQAVESWTGTNCSLAAAAGVLTATSTGVNPSINSPVIAVDGSRYSIVRIRARPRSAAPTWEGKLFYSTAGHGMTAGFYKEIPDPGIVQDRWYEFEFDMAALTAGGADWTTNTITGIRFDATSANQNWQIDWIAIGAYAPSSFTGDVQASLDLAISRLADLALDSKLTGEEKKTLRTENGRLESIYQALVIRATAAGATEATTAATAARTAWHAYRNAIAPAWDDITTTSVIVRVDFEAAVQAWVTGLETFVTEIETAPARRVLDPMFRRALGPGSCWSPNALGFSIGATSATDGGPCLVVAGTAAADVMPMKNDFAWEAKKDQKYLARIRVKISSAAYTRAGANYYMAYQELDASKTPIASYNLVTVTEIDAKVARGNVATFEITFTITNTNTRYCRYRIGQLGATTGGQVNVELFDVDLLPDQVNNVNQKVLIPAPTQTLLTSSTGSVIADQLPRVVANKMMVAGVDVTELCAWSRVATAGVTCTISDTAGTKGKLTISSPTVPGAITVTAVYLGVTYPAQVKVEYQADVGESSTTTKTVKNVAAVLNSATYVNVDTEFTIVCGASGIIVFDYFLRYNAASVVEGTFKMRWRVAGGSFADVSGSETSGSANTIDPDFTFDGFAVLSGTVSVSGLTAGLTYGGRLQGYRDSGSASMTVSGTAEVSTS